MNVELKPCPFCGGEAETIKSFLYGQVTGYIVCCKKCKCESSMYSSKQNAEKSWNKRCKI